MVESKPIFSCTESKTLSVAEKSALTPYLELHGLDSGIWDFFTDLAQKSTSSESFFFLKVLDKGDLVGLALVSRVEHYNPYQALHSKLRRFAILETLLKVSRLFGRNVMYCAMSEILCANLDGPCFVIHPEMRAEIKAQIGHYLRSKSDASYVVIMDSTSDRATYMANGFAAFPYCSSAWIDSSRYASLGKYLEHHNRTRKKLLRFHRRRRVDIEIVSGVVSGSDLDAMRASLACSADNTRSVIPFQRFFDAHILETEAFRSDNYLHIILRLDGRLVGFTTFKKCARHLGAILGGFDRAYTYDNPIYDQVMLSALEYAIDHGMERVHFGIVNNFTKARLTDSYESLDFYFFSPIWLYRALQRWLYRIWTPHELHELETKALGGRATQ